MAKDAQVNWYLIGGAVALVALGGGALASKAKTPATVGGSAPAPAPSTPGGSSAPVKPSPVSPYTPTKPTGETFGPPSSLAPGNSPFKGGRLLIPPGCNYQAPSASYTQTRGQMIQRVRDRIMQVQPSLGNVRVNGYGAAAELAAAIVDIAAGYRLPVDLVTALCRRESNFNLYVDSVTAAIAKGGVKGFGAGSEIGPFQVKPGVFRDVGLDANWMLSQTLDKRLNYAVGAGIAYLAKCRDKYLPLHPNKDLCEMLLIYTEGPTGSLVQANRDKKAGYVRDIIRWANEYTELKGDWS